MFTFKSSVALATILVAGLLVSACGQGSADVKTTTPSSMLGTDSAATKVGGMPPDTAQPRPAPSKGAMADTNRLSTGQ